MTFKLQQFAHQEHGARGRGVEGGCQGKGLAARTIFMGFFKLLFSNCMYFFVVACQKNVLAFFILA